MIKNIQWQVTAEEAGARLDQAVRARCPTAPRAQVVAAIADGRVRVNGAPVEKSRRVAAGDRVEIDGLLERADIRVRPEPDRPLTVVYADDDLIAIDKPAGQPVQPLSPDETGTLAGALVARYPDLQGVGDQPLMPGILHRLDAGTSGLVLAARTAAAFEGLRSQFQRQTVEKVYLARVRGRVGSAGTIDGWLAHEPSQRGKMRALPAAADAPGGERPLRARTDYVPLGPAPSGTWWLRVTIFTGVTHQIRCQLAAIGHPVFGDVLYGQPRGAEAPRHWLHAWALRCRHPRDGRELRLATDWPGDFGPPVEGHSKLKTPAGLLRG